MNTPKRKILALILLFSLFLVSVVLASPLATGVDRYVISSGGGHAEAGIYSLDSSIGQTVVGVDSAGSFELCAGFWCLPESFSSSTVYLPLVIKP
jgi:hypothetical protein